MRVTVIGKEWVNKVSKKTGEMMDKTIVHFTHKKRGVEGVAVQSVWVDAAILPYTEITVGKDYALDRNERGYLDDFSPIR